MDQTNQIRCPLCQSRSIGRVGSEQYYCWDCCIEFAVTRGGVRLFRVDSEGELQALEPGDYGSPIYQ